MSNEETDCDYWFSNFPISQLVEAYVAYLPDDSIVVSGGAKGVDSSAVQAAEDRGLEVVQLPFGDFERYEGQVALPSDTPFCFSH